MFISVHSLYCQELIKSDNKYMTVYYNFLSYITYKPKVISRALCSINNYKFHYHSQYLDVSCSLKKKL
jgi:hypothetical protein